MNCCANGQCEHRSAAQLARDALTTCKGEMRDWHFEHPAIKQLETALAALEALQSDLELANMAKDTWRQIAANNTQLKAENAKLRGLLLWALYHNQGSNSPAGQPIRRALGIGQYDRLTEDQVLAACNASTA